MASRSDTDLGSNDEPQKLTAVDLQQLYYETVGDADWELYEQSERKYLLQKVARALFGPPTIEGNLDKDDESSELKLQGYELRDSDTVMNVFNKISEKAKYSHNGKNIVISTLRVICVVPRKEVPFFVPTPADYWVDLHKKNSDEVNLLIFHVFCLRKCINMRATGKGCKIYIDHDGRVYQSWQDYMNDNKLPKCVMVVPKDGVYKGEIKTEGSIPVVRLTIAPSPALGLTAKVLSVADTTSIVASIGGVAAIVGALALPAIAPVAMTTAVGIGVCTGVYGITRSTMQLADRKKHEQDIDLTSSEARGCWINIIVSTAGLSLGAATKLLTWAAASGTNVKILMNAVTVLQFTNIGSSAVGVANGLGEMIFKYNRYKETPSGVEIFQFTTSLLFLGLGVMSNQTATEIVQDAQANKINEIRDSLSSNTKRKMFDKVTAETRRLEGSIQGNADVIKGLKNIKNKDDFFAKIARMNKDANKNKIRISMASDGNAVINNNVKVDLAEFYSLGRQGRNQMFAEYGPADLTTKNVPTRIYASNVSTASVNINDQESSFRIRPEELLSIAKVLIDLCQLDKEFIAEIMSTFSETAHDAFLLVCAKFVESLLPEELTVLMDNFGISHYKMIVILFVFRYLKSMVSECDYENDNAIVIVLKEFFGQGRIKRETILMLKRKLFDIIDSGNANDLLKYDDIESFRKTYTSKFLDLRAGEVVNIEDHAIIVKATTIEKLDEWLKDFSQTQCDIFMALCFKIIGLLKVTEKEKIILINPDEDVIMRVSSYLMNETPIEFLLYEEFTDSADVSADKVMCLKDSMLEWRTTQYVRKHRKCVSCNGLLFC